jgi:hypothetical protein
VFINATDQDTDKFLLRPAKIVLWDAQIVQTFLNALFVLRVIIFINRVVF